jgi:hypothetical protein
MSADGTAKVELEPGARAKNFQFFFQPSFQGAGLKILRALAFGEQIADLSDRFVDVLFDDLQLRFNRGSIV